MKKPQLLLFHFAGGSMYSFQFIQPLLQEFELLMPELPGRGKRVKETLLQDFEAAVTDMYHQVQSRITGTRLLVYGHSMGAYLALQITHLLEQAGHRPGHLLVSGNGGPGLGDNKKRYAMDTDSFKEELKTLGGLPPEIIEHQEMYELFEPVLRADFRISENNGICRSTVVNAPIYAMMGSGEEQAEHIGNWKHFTRSRFQYEIMEGDHFFIHKHPARLAAIIKQCYRQGSLHQHS